MKKRILVTGGTGRFGSILKKLKTKHRMFFPGKTTLDITKFISIQKYIRLIIQISTEKNASDIHIEPQDNYYNIRI